MRELLQDIIARATRGGAEFADVRAGIGHSTSVTAEDGRIHRCSSSASKGIGLRVLVGGAWGFAQADSHEPVVLRRCLEDALALAQAAAGHVAEPATVAQVTPIEAVSRYPVRIDPSAVPLSERVSTIAAYEERVRKHHASIVNSVVAYHDGSGVTELVNSFGTYVRWEAAQCSLYVMATAANDQTRQMSLDGIARPAGWEVVADADMEAMAGGAAQRAVELLDAVEPPAGMMPVIVDPGMTGLITHEAFGHNCEADLVWAGESIVAGKEGQMVAVPSVTVIDDPTWDWNNGSYEYDDEGVPARKRVLVQDGVLTEYLHSLETAAHFGVEPNGAARAASRRVAPVPRMSNTFIAPGEAKLEDLVADVDKGVMVVGERGGYVDTARGHFSFSAESGYEIENGKLGRKLRNCTLTGYTLETLQQVLGVSKEFDLINRGSCGKKGQGVRVSVGGPYLYIRELTVGGSRVVEDEDEGEDE
jgi:TldD protein